MQTTPELPTVVVKLGGSLLDLKDLAARLRGLFLLLQPMPVSLVVGGGPAADLVRVWDEKFGFSDNEAHWLAIRAMRLTEMLVESIVPECQLVTWRNMWDELDHFEHFILAIEPLLVEARKNGDLTPFPSWDVTSDSLAAWATKYIGAKRLVLAKSVDAPQGGLAEAVSAKLVDPWFERTSEGLDVQWINLRAESPQLAPLIR